MDESRGLYHSFDQWVRNLSRGRYAILAGFVSVIFVYGFAFTPVGDYAPPPIVVLVGIGVVMTLVAYAIRPHQPLITKLYR